MEAAIIGVIGTVFGTILGWILGRLDFGRLHISFTDFENDFSALGDMCYIPGIEANQIYSYTLSTTIQLYNSSNINRVMRNPQFVFNDGKRDFLSLAIYDNATRSFVSKIPHYNRLEIANVLPHEGKDFKVHAYTEQIDDIFNTKKIYVCYKKENLRVRKILLKSVDFSKQPRFIQEEQINDT